MAPPIRIANISGMFGDRPSAAVEMVEGGPVDVLTGDWLAELTMLILATTRQRRPDGGYGRTFIPQVERIMGTCLDRGIKVAVNAGGLDPTGLAEAVEEVAQRLGLTPTVAAITGDDLVPLLGDLDGVEFRHADTGESLGDRRSLIATANAYLGGWGIATALDLGADIVVTGRVTDASLLVGPAAWHHGWGRHDWDRLAGAVVAGHVVECGMQATGGNYSFFTEIDDLDYPAFPWAEVAEDGSSVIGTHGETGGAVTIGTVTSQLLYEIDGPRYRNPDVTARFDTVGLEQIDVDRVKITGTRGEPPPADLKVAMSLPGGFRNSATIGITGLEAEAKAGLLHRQFWRACPWDPEDYEQVRETLIGTPADDPASNAAAVTFWEISVRDPDEEKVGRAWSDTFAHIALGSIPGFFAASPPGAARRYALYWPTSIPRSLVSQHVHLPGEVVEVVETEVADAGRPEDQVPPPPAPEVPVGPGTTRHVPLGTVVGARSGDKGGNANLGVFARNERAFRWLAGFLTVARLRDLFSELAGHEIDRYEFPNLNAVNFVVHGLLDEGVASSLRVDPQAKGLAEYVRARHVEVPVSLLD